MLNPKKSENIEISTSAFDYQPSRISALKMTFYARVKIKNNRKDKNKESKEKYSTVTTRLAVIPSTLSSYG